MNHGHDRFHTSTPSIIFYKAHTHIKIQTIKSLTNNLVNNFYLLQYKLDVVRFVIKCSIQLLWAKHKQYNIKYINGQKYNLEDHAMLRHAL
jgi:hypothetical protein